MAGDRAERYHKGKDKRIINLNNLTKLFIMKKFYAFAAAALVALGAYAQDGAPLYLTGDGSSLPATWAPESPAEFEYEDGQYTMTVSDLTMFKVSTILGSWDDFNGAALTCDYGEEQGVAVALVPGDANIMCPWTGEWTVVVAGDLSTITLTTTTPKPANEGIKLYLRGDMNGWGAEDAWLFEQMQDNKDVFKFVCSEGQGIMEGEAFKIADAAWAKYNYGGDGLEILLDMEMELFYNSNNLTIEEEWNGVAWFTLDGNLLAMSNDLDYVPDFYDPSAVEGIAADNAVAKYFNLQGIAVENPTKGLYIVVKGDKTYKVVK